MLVCFYVLLQKPFHISVGAGMQIKNGADKSSKKNSILVHGKVNCQITFSGMKRGKCCLIKIYLKNSMLLKLPKNLERKNLECKTDN